MSYISKYSGSEIDSGLDKVNNLYPVGSIYISTTSTSPASLFGGTWEALKDKFLIGAGGSYSNGATGGATSHTHTSAAHTHSIDGHTHTTAAMTLTVNQIPSHRHTGLDIDGVYIFGWDTGSIKGFDMNEASLGGQRNTANRITTSYTGGGQSHSHGNTGSTSLTTNSTTPGATGSTSSLPPYLAVYMWKRTA